MSRHLSTLRILLGGLVVAWCVSVAVPAAAQSPRGKTWTPARTAWGDPDLQGIFTNRNEMSIPLERPHEFDGRRLDDVKPDELLQLLAARQKAAAALAPTFGGSETGAGPIHWYEYYGAKNSRAWLIVDPPDGRVPPLTDEAQKRTAARAEALAQHGESDSHEDRSLYDRCITRGIPASMMPGIYGMAYQFVQSPGYVAIRYEMIHETRLIPLDGRAHLGSGIRSYLGDARGHWDGDTLVVETVNFNGRVGGDNGYFSPEQGSSANLRLVERFKPVGPDTMEWSVTLDDPSTWVRPWTYAMNLTKDSGGVFEYACHEGNYGLMNILSAARAEERGKEH